MSERYSVRVTKDTLVFSAGHFITFNGDVCERLHGHNWRVAVEIDGPLDENHYVFDFIALRDRSLEIVAELDHRMLVAMNHPQMPVTETKDEFEIRYKTKRWVFPREDCVLLPVENTTTELIARYFARRLLMLLKDRHQYTPPTLRVTVEENFGQTATVELCR